MRIAFTAMSLYIEYAVYMSSSSIDIRVYLCSDVNKFPQQQVDSMDTYRPKGQIQEKTKKLSGIFLIAYHFISQGFALTWKTWKKSGNLPAKVRKCCCMKPTFSRPKLKILILKLFQDSMPPDPPRESGTHNKISSYSGNIREIL